MLSRVHLALGLDCPTLLAHPLHFLADPFTLITKPVHKILQVSWLTRKYNVFGNADVQYKHHITEAWFVAEEMSLWMLW